MIVTKTPLRISFVGGGTDLPGFLARYGKGAVVSTTIGLYVYVAVHKRFDGKTVAKYSDTEVCDSVEEIKHPIIREALRKFWPSGGIEVTSFADVPDTGIGLGSSSAFTVGLCHALRLLRGDEPKEISSRMLAEDAIDIEINRLQAPIGRQDQVAAAYGGFNLIEFDAAGTFRVTRPDAMAPGRQDAWKSMMLTMRMSMLLVFTGATRAASKVLSQEMQWEQLENQVYAAVEYWHDLKNFRIERTAMVINGSHVAKFAANPAVETEAVKRVIEFIRNYNVTGCKLLGAGSGGMLLIYCPNPNQRRILKTDLAAYDSANKTLDVYFEDNGSVGFTL